MAFEVFLSHYGADEPLAREVEARAKALDISVYMYQNDPQAGGQLATKLEERIRTADAVVALLTNEGVKRPSVHTEIGIARTLRKPVIPVVESGIDRGALLFLQGIELVVLDREQPDLAFLHLQRSLTKLRERARENALLIGIILAVIAAMFIAYAVQQGKAAK